MTEVDFYIMSDPEETVLMRVACRLAESAWGDGERVYLLAADDAQAARMDEMLWTFRQDSFVPHERVGGDNPPTARVLVGTGQAVPERIDMLVNLGAEIPPWYGLCARVAEVVGAKPGEKAAGRKRYRMYRDAGAELRTHEV